ncbi:hypothetical protein N8205_00220 [Flavobacteriaceae bacterium]|jgi:hypothetical protein|nr:hypothetical protein [Flavobacteriaceae bacterium]
MNSLNELIGQTVNARIEIDVNDVHNVVGEVLSVHLNDFYFYEKGEPIYITVSISPLGELDDDIDSETLASVPLEYITKSII